MLGIETQLVTEVGDKWGLELTGEGIVVTCNDMPDNVWVAHTPTEAQRVLAQIAPSKATPWQSYTVKGFPGATRRMVLSFTEAAWLAGALAAALHTWDLRGATASTGARSATLVRESS